MIVTKAKYYKDQNGVNGSINATIDNIECCVPIAEDNTHYQAILKWVAEGNTIEEAD
jgi:hypothetical protein